MAGGGKALRHGEKVLTPQGFVNIEDIKIGDKVITPTNTVETVKNVWPQGEVEIYRITFQDSRTIDCCGEHLWKYHIAGRGNRDSKVGDTLSLKSIVDKEHSKESGERKRLPIIPLCEPVGNTTPSDLPIHPYVLGVILGDGCLSSDNTPRVTSMDDFIFNKIENLGYKLGSVQRKENNRAYARAILDIYHHVKDLGIGQKKSQFKFIPEVYKNSSIEDKFELVRGLMDTDGYVDEEGSTYFDITSEQLSNDLREILFSLGFTAKVTAKQGKYKKNGEVVECSTVYKLYIRGNLQEKLCSLPRKVVRLRKKNVGIRVESVEYVGKDFATCIAITGEDKLFVTTNYIVTHNSAVCLMKQLDAIHDPLFRCTIFRRTAPELLRSGALVDESKKVYSHFNAEYKSQAKEWIFPSGAVVKFGAIASDDDLGGWQGSQLTRVLVDEAGEGWTEKQILFLLSRMRTAGCSIHPQLIMTANPDGASFLKKWVDYCLDENGVPKEGTENIIRWFVVLDSVVLWGDSPQELFEKHGKERGMVLATGLSDDELKKHHPSSLFMPKSFRFIPTNVFDNPYLLPPRNNSYLPNLLAQPKVNQLKYLHGSWTAKAEGEGYWKREWVKLVDRPPATKVKTIRAWDLAATEVSEANRDPDWTAGVKLSRDKFGNYCIEDVIRFRKSTAQVLEEIIKTARNDGLDEVEVVIPKDSGAGGSAANLFFVRALAENGISVRSAQISGHMGKLNRFLPFASISEAGAVSVVKADWNEPYFSELENFIPNNRNQKDD